MRPHPPPRRRPRLPDREPIGIVTAVESDFPPATAAVLVVDDNAENLGAFDAALAPLATRLGVRVALADSSDAALRHALAEGDQLAVVLLDVMMPGTDGTEIARLIRQRRQSAHVPIIFVTALDADRMRLSGAYESGAVDYLTKPVDLDLLRAKVAAFVDLHRRQTELRQHERRRLTDEARAISERAAAEAAAARARLAAVLDSLPDMVSTFDAAWRFVYCNPAAAERLRARGHSADAVIGRTLWEIAPELRGTHFEVELRRAARERRVVAFESYLSTVEFWLDNRAVPGPDGTITLFSRDVTERVEAERERERLLAEAQIARSAAEEANAAKGRFLATMSHELRTPLNAIAGHVQLVEMGIHGPVTDAQREALGRVARAQQHLLALINDLLDYAKVESGRVEYDMQPTRVADVVARIAPLIEPQTIEKALRLDVRLSAAPETHAIEVWADPDRLGQILLNLLSNAVKFTPAGGRVGVELAGRGDDPGVAELRVWDTGIGIAADRQQAIFDPFVQAHRELAVTRGGTGLGLAISRDLARGMGGDLTVASVEGEGSTFVVTLRRR